MSKKARKRQEKEYLDRLSGIGCIACLNMGYEDSPATIHHITGAGMALKSSDYEAIPLCHYHHQGAGGIHTIGNDTWEAIHGTQEELLQQVRNML